MNLEELILYAEGCEILYKRYFEIVNAKAMTRSENPALVSIEEVEEAQKQLGYYAMLRDKAIQAIQDNQRFKAISNKLTNNEELNVTTTINMRSTIYVYLLLFNKI